MYWRFKLIDRNNIITVVDEPTGWDNDIVKIARDEKWHGIFFTKQSENLVYDGVAARLLKKEYDTYGWQGIMFIQMEERCNEVWEVADIGRFIFSAFKDACGDECTVMCPVETSGDIIDIRNRVNQKVDLDTRKAFDGITDLPVYDKLPLLMLLPSKGIELHDDAEDDKSIKIPVDGAPATIPAGNNSEYGMVEFGMNKIVASEIGGFSFPEDPFYNCVLTTSGPLGCSLPSPDAFWLYPDIISIPNKIVCPLNLAPTVNYSDGLPNFGVVSDVCDLDINLAVGFENVNLTSRDGYAILCRLPAGKVGNAVGDYDWLYVVPGASLVYHDPAFVLNRGDRLYCFIAMYHLKTEAQTNTPIPAFKMNMIPGSFFRLETLTHAKPTIAKIYMINEVLSRILECITNNRVKVYSDHYGRTDSQPYSVVADGCGSMRGITNGIRVRAAENRVPGMPQVYAVSLQDAFDGINPIDNIGIGLEPDPARPGFNRCRVEPWRFFYNNDVIMTCDNVALITREVYNKNIFSTFTFGYAKWEAEEYNGLDEFLTKRIYRTTLNDIQNDFSQISKFVASGYAWEITRRKGNLDSKDWRYDNDTFIVVCRRAGFTLTVNNTGFFMTIAPGLALTGSDILTIANAIDQSTGAPIPSINGDYALSFPITTGGVTTTSIFPALPEGNYLVDLLINGVPVTSDNIGVDLGDVDTPTNIIDPPTIYNWPITPVRNAMRWMNRVLMSYNVFDDDAKIIFTDGDGNYFAGGKQKNDACRIEGQVIAENVTISRVLFEEYAAVMPFLRAEGIVYDYPMSTVNYRSIKANPYGTIVYNGCKNGSAWIDFINYDRSKGMGSFNLIPKIIIL